MTCSIVARCADSGMLGVGAVTGTAGVGTLLSWIEAGVGAVATQGWVNPYLGIDALALLRTGHHADKALEAVIGLDEDAALRQVGVVDATGRIAAHTGADCSPTADHLTGDGFSVQGNLLTGHDVLDEAAAALTRSSGRPLVERLLVGLEAAVAAGGDERGHRSAHVLVADTELYPLWDVRVDDHDHPLTELRRLVDRFEEQLLPQVRKLPTRGNLRGELDAADRAGLV
ncbi:MAG: DUF1028 domain-containing protein [Nitriliruptoraceae bacterium]|nr:DUF1028 domain-containing protein [Nitriliruptoraceae bacterium]